MMLNEYGRKPTTNRQYAKLSVRSMVEANPWGWHIVRRHCQITENQLISLFIYANTRFRYWKKVIKAMQTFSLIEGFYEHTHIKWKKRIDSIEYTPTLGFSPKCKENVKKIEKTGNYSPKL